MLLSSLLLSPWRATLSRKLLLLPVWSSAAAVAAVVAVVVVVVAGSVLSHEFIQLFSRLRMCASWGAGPAEEEMLNKIKNEERKNRAPEKK